MRTGVNVHSARGWWGGVGWRAHRSGKVRTVRASATGGCRPWGALVPLACVDDVFGPDSLQAVVTVGTEAGATYYIQAGGFAGETGTLVVSLE